MRCDLLKLLTLSLFLFTGTIFTFAQVQEVKGVVTRVACYDDCHMSKDSEKVYGFEYENLNNFSVTIEAEMWRNVYGRQITDDFIANTKVFVLKPGEKYIWKVNMRGYIGDYSPNLGRVPLSKEGYYTKFKAYKNE